MESWERIALRAEAALKELQLKYDVVWKEKMKLEEENAIIEGGLDYWKEEAEQLKEQVEYLSQKLKPYDVVFNRENEHKIYTIAGWQYEVEDDATLRGYNDWVHAEIESNADNEIKDEVA